MKRAKVTPTQRKLHPRDARSPEYAAWRRSLSTGKRKATLKRRAKGLHTPAEIAVQFALPVAFVRRMVESGELPAITSGARRYVRTGDVERVFGVREETAAFKTETGADAA
jgi:excisionase family DNA binding protein